ncbi:hypothetical protein Tco_0758434 [Tanacetum coccineum]
MDVNNQNKELNKEKVANETEDNDKMKNNDMKNDSVQEKQDTDKDENAKVDNVKEKQGDDKDEIGEDEFCYTQFTDSQCEEMENQAKKKHPRDKDRDEEISQQSKAKWDRGKQHRLWGFLDDAHGELQRGECKELEPEIPNRGRRK